MSRRLFATEGKRRTKCPLCGGEIGVSDLYQYEYNYRITKRGKISKNGKRRDCGSMEVSVAHCECGANWEQGDFEITEEGYFIDYKYRHKE